MLSRTTGCPLMDDFGITMFNEPVVPLSPATWNVNVFASWIINGVSEFELTVREYSKSHVA